MKKFIKFNNVLQELGKEISGVAILAMMLLVVADVVSRNFLNFSVQGTYPIVEMFLMPLAIFPALGYAYYQNVLPRLTELVEKAPEIYKFINDILISIIEIIVFSLLTYFTFVHFQGMLNSGRTITIAGSYYPLWPIYLLVPIGFYLVVQQVVIRIYLLVTDFKDNRKGSTVYEDNQG